MAKFQSASSLREISPGRKLHEWITHFFMRVRGAWAPNRFAWLTEDLDQYHSYTQRLVDKPLTECKVLEVGFGARPYRLFALTGTAADAVGMDLDVPLLRGTPKEILTIWRANGAERALKSVARHFLFDMPERGALRAAIQKAGGHFSIDPSRFIIGDASEDRTWVRLAPSSFDLIVSEDVLEHVAADRLPQLLEQIANHLRPNGIALLRPFIFTGIAGNHLPEWYPHVVDKRQERRSAPWEHLRMDRFRANTFLNRLTRADFRSLIAEHFDILEENVKFPDLGRQYLNFELRNELKHYDDDELFSNSVLFVLRRRRDQAAIE